MATSRFFASMCALGLLLLPQAGRAQGVPGTMTFTAKVASNGAPASGPHSFGFKLFAVETGGMPVWQEEDRILTIMDGLIMYELGTRMPLDSAIFDGDKLYLEVVIDAVPMAPRIPVVSVPYAIRAGVATNAELLGVHEPDDFITGVAPGAGLTGGGTTGDVTLGAVFAGRGSADTVARSDHDHPDYLTDITTAATSGLALTNGAGPSPAIGLMSCAAGNVLKSTGTGWACAPVDVTGVTAAEGGGLTVGAAR